MSDEEKWRNKLSAEEFRICREKGTERAFTGVYWDHWEEGKYLCKCCGEILFNADSKFDAGCGWPSFFEAESDNKIKEHRDSSLGMVRTEVVCANCGGHLGHVFPDGPAPTGLRYCINSASINHQKDSE